MEDLGEDQGARAAVSTVMPGYEGFAVNAKPFRSGGVTYKGDWIC